MLYKFGYLGDPISPFFLPEPVLSEKQLQLIDGYFSKPQWNGQ